MCVDVCIPLSDSAEGDRRLGEVRDFTAASWQRPSAACGCQVVSSQEGRTEQGLVVRRAPGVLPHVRLGGGRRLFAGGERHGRLQREAGFGLEPGERAGGVGGASSPRRRSGCGPLVASER